MGISYLKSAKDSKNFRLAKGFGLDVYEIENLGEADKKIQELVNKNYNTIIISKEVASFSQDIITKYKKEDNINIIISYK